MVELAIISSFSRRHSGIAQFILSGFIVFTKRIEDRETIAMYVKE